MAELSTVARPYARAAYQYAVEHNIVADWRAMLHGLAIIASDKRVRHYLSNPELTMAQMVEIFLVIGKEVLNNIKSSEDFLKTLAENKRLLLLPYVATIFEKLYAQDESIMKVDVTSAQVLSESYKTKIIESLEKRFKKTVQLHTHIDKSLLAGAIIRIDDDLVIDRSALSQLQRLKQELV